MIWMKWLTAILVALLVGLAACPAAVGGWLGHRAESIHAISYVPGMVDELSASRRQHRHHEHDQTRPQDQDHQMDVLPH